MPFVSRKQITWMKKNRSDIYMKWKKKYGLKIRKHKKRK